MVTSFGAPALHKRHNQKTVGIMLFSLACTRLGKTLSEFTANSSGDLIPRYVICLEELKRDELRRLPLLSHVLRIHLKQTAELPRGWVREPIRAVRGPLVERGDALFAWQAYIAERRQPSARVARDPGERVAGMNTNECQ